MDMGQRGSFVLMLLKVVLCTLHCTHGFEPQQIVGLLMVISWYLMGGVEDVTWTDTPDNCPRRVHSHPLQNWP